MPTVKNCCVLGHPCCTINAIVNINAAVNSKRVRILIEHVGGPWVPRSPEIFFNQGRIRDVDDSNSRDRLRMIRNEQK